MKKQYKCLLIVIITEIFVASILDQYNIQIQSWIGNAIAAFVCFSPIEVLLYMIGQDNSFSNPKRICCKIAFWFILASYLLGGVLLLIEK